MPDKLDYKQSFRQAFANRLKSKLLENGYYSNRGVNHVCGQQLAKAIGLSLPMVRRYINGNSIPEDATLKKIAAWLNVEPLWLLYGNDSNTANSPPPSKFNNAQCFQNLVENSYSLLGATNLSKEQYVNVVMDCFAEYCCVGKKCY